MINVLLKEEKRKRDAKLNYNKFYSNLLQKNPDMSNENFFSRK